MHPTNNRTTFTFHTSIIVVRSYVFFLAYLLEMYASARRHRKRYIIISTYLHHTAYLLSYTIYGCTRRYLRNFLQQFFWVPVVGCNRLNIFAVRVPIFRWRTLYIIIYCYEIEYSLTLSGIGFSIVIVMITDRRRRQVYRPQCPQKSTAHCVRVMLLQTGEFKNCQHVVVYVQTRQQCA